MRNLIDHIEPNHLMTIEWQMMDPQKYLPLSMINVVCLRTIIYPLTVIKTRLQIQTHHAVYKGLFDAGRTIFRLEGIGAFYKGFLINTMQVGSGVSYIITLEKVKDLLCEYRCVDDPSMRSLIGGAVASLVGQTIINPFDCISQHMMVVCGTKRDRNTNRFSSYANPLRIDRKDIDKFGLGRTIIRELYRSDGIKGFYRGYFASLLCFVPNNAIFWFCYEKYSQMIHAYAPSQTLHLLIRNLAAILSGATVAVLFNPLDVLRTNIQVQRLPLNRSTMKKLWRDEKFNLLYKGITARVAQNCISSALISIGYETLKRLSIREEYKNQVKW